MWVNFKVSCSTQHSDNSGVLHAKGDAYCHVYLCHLNLLEGITNIVLWDCDEMKEGNVALCGLSDLSLLSLDELRPPCLHASAIQALHDKGALSYPSRDKEASNMHQLSFKPSSPVTILASGNQLSMSCDFTSSHFLSHLQTEGVCVCVPPG